MFVDRARIKVTAGAGGSGCCSFRREKYIPRGGPNGGDGGKGGDICFVASARLTSMLDLQHHAHWKAERGEHGQGSDCHGKNGADQLVPVPMGTLVRDFKTNEILADLVGDGQRFLAARGGRGGRGNARFTSSTNRAPHFAELGEPGEEVEYLLELKVIEEVGIVGLPNAGKSTLLAAVSAARPKIDGYPFTTLSPNLGVAQLSDHRTLTVADIPGIIEGAHEGKGLGTRFLRHIERNSILLFMISVDTKDIKKEFQILINELKEYNPELLDKSRVLAITKCDLADEELINEMKKDLPKEQTVFISSHAQSGLKELKDVLWQKLNSYNFI